MRDLIRQALDDGAAVRLGVFLGLVVALAIWELLAQRRPLSQSRPRRWLANLGLSALDSVVVRLLSPITAVGLALVVEQRGWGLFHWLDAPAPVAFVVSILVLDLAIYAQHVVFHAVPALWRLHAVHHTDQDVDLTTGVRFHPVEILVSAFFKLAVVALLGAPAEAVLVFAIVLNATSMFNHSNVRLPLSVDRLVRWIVVTPDMHRVHHSVEPRETHSNFGFNLPWWDRLFGTYRAQPGAGHEGMRLGVDALWQSAPRNLMDLLVLPGRWSARAPKESSSEAGSDSRG